MNHDHDGQIEGIRTFATSGIVVAPISTQFAFLVKRSLARVVPS